ncbi:MAG: type II toxin-antitoxin system HicB family antitoxin [Bacillota bacterium]
MGYAFPVIVEQDETGMFIATCPVFTGCYTQGHTLDEALANIKEAILLCLDETPADELPLKDKLC